jgi:hypothetical protein
VILYEFSHCPWLRSSSEPGNDSCVGAESQNKGYINKGNTINKVELTDQAHQAPF